MLAINEQLYAGATASYSGTFESYWSRLNVGYDVGGFAVGPEILFMGDDSYDQKRYGVFIDHPNLSKYASLGLSGGFSDASHRGSNSGYLELRVSSRF